MIPFTLPERPWEKIGTDLLELKGKSFLLLVDYFSRYVVVKLTCTTTKSVVAAMKPLCARHGIPYQMSQCSIIFFSRASTIC